MTGGVVALVATLGLSLSACSSVRPALDEPSSAEATTSDAADDATDADTADADGPGVGASPVIFAFTCRSAAGRSTTYTTYAAVWDAHRTSCTATRVTGSVPSAQQREALDATDDTIELDRLAAACAVTDTAPWTAAVDSAAAARLAAGVVAYCPGHPDRDRLAEALAAYDG